jgi:hypothetical protein
MNSPLLLDPMFLDQLAQLEVKEASKHAFLYLSPSKDKSIINRHLNHEVNRVIPIRRKLLFESKTQRRPNLRIDTATIYLPFWNNEKGEADVLPATLTETYYPDLTELNDEEVNVIEEEPDLAYFQIDTPDKWTYDNRGKERMASYKETQGFHGGSNRV